MDTAKFAEISTLINRLRNLLETEHGFTRENALRAAWNHFLPNVSFDRFVEEIATR